MRSDQKLAATYYDQIRVYLQIRAYTGDVAKWTPCVNAALNTYRGYVIGAGGKTPGYWNFSGGLRMHFELTGDTESKRASLRSPLARS